MVETAGVEEVGRAHAAMAGGGPWVAGSRQTATGLLAVVGLVGGVLPVVSFWLAGPTGARAGAARPRGAAPPTGSLLRLRGGGGRGRQTDAWGRDRRPRPGEGGTIEDVVNERAHFEVRRPESEQLRRLRKRREQWRQRVRPVRPADDDAGSDLGDSDELSSEGDISSDRPDAYKKPQEPVETDFKETGLPDWLDPIYDYAEPSEYVRAGVCGDGDSNEGFNADIAGMTQDPDTGEFHVEYNRIPGLLHPHDHLKDLTVSEWEEIERIWDFKVRRPICNGRGRGWACLILKHACMHLSTYLEDEHARCVHTCMHTLPSTRACMRAACPCARMRKRAQTHTHTHTHTHARALR